jgi:hypothetical protein
MTFVAGSAAAEPSASPRKRLDFTATRVTLKEATKSLGDAAGCPLRVAESLAIRPVVLMLRGRTADEAMADLARFVATSPGKCSWTFDTSSGCSTLVEDAANRKARVNKTESQRVSRYRQLISDMETAMRLALLPLSELVRARSRHPELAYTAPRLRRVYGILAGLNTDQRRALLSGKGLSLRIGELPPAEQGYAQAMMGSILSARVSVPPELGGGHMDWLAERDLPRTPLSIRLAGRPDRPGITVSIAYLPGVRRGARDALHPNPPAEADRPEWLKDILKERERKEQKARQEFLDTVKGDPQLRTPVTLNAMVDVPDPKRPGRTIKRFSDLADTLTQVADQTRLSIIGDYDPCWDDYYTRLDLHNPDMRSKQLLRGNLPSMPAWQAMEFVRTHFAVEWEKRGSVLYVRSPRIPYALMDKIDVLDPPLLPNYWQILLRTYKPGDRLPGVTYDEH